MSSTRAVSLVLALVAASSTTAHAAPPPDDAGSTPADSGRDTTSAAEASAPPADPQARAADSDTTSAAEAPAPPSDPQAREAEARRLFGEGLAKFEVADYPGAIELWEQAYDLLPLDRRGELPAFLANAHLKAYYEGDEDPEHLRKARVLFQDHLDALDASNVEARAEAEDLLAEVEAELERIEREAATREREMAEREASAREEAAKQVITEQLQSLNPWDEDDQRRYQLYVGVGGSLIGLSAVSFGFTAVGLVLSAQLQREGAGKAPGPDLQDWIDGSPNKPGGVQRGLAYNQMAWISGAIGTGLLAAGTTLVVLAVLDRKRAREELERLEQRARLRPTLGGLEVRF